MLITLVSDWCSRVHINVLSVTIPLQLGHSGYQKGHSGYRLMPGNGTLWIPIHEIGLLGYCLYSSQKGHNGYKIE